MREAADRRDSGIASATQHANNEIPSWSIQADNAMMAAIHMHGKQPFLAEELIEVAVQGGAPSPPDGRAWGGVFRRLAIRGIIRKVGYAPAKSSNLSPKVLWEA